MPSAGLDCNGQNTVEAIVVFGILVAALVAMQTYVKRGLQARYRTVVDGAVTAIGASPQYEPYYASSGATVTQESEVTSRYAPGGTITKTEQTRANVEESEQRVGVDVAADNDWR